MSIKAHFELKNILQNIDQKSCELYASIEGEYLFNNYTLYIDQVDIEPSNPIARVRVQVSQDIAKFPDVTYKTRSREIALRDFITRKLYENSKDSNFQIQNPGQEILESTSCLLDRSSIEIRLTAILSSYENRVSSKETENTLFNVLQYIIESSLLFQNLDSKTLYKHIETNEDADFLRAELENLRLIAFVAESSILQRNTDNKCPNSDSTPFSSPPNLKMDIELPNSGQITGMGIPRGITYIVGESKSGKSTLLDAISQGIYNHIPGDGREFAVSNPNSVKISPEKGRSVECVDISAFREDSACFSTDSADYTASVAANIIESVEIGADVLLVDQECVDIYIEKARSLFTDYMVSTILAGDELSDYYDTANFVIHMNNYSAQEMASDKKIESIDYDKYNSIGHIQERIPISETVDISTLDLSNIEQIVSKGQISAIEDTILYARKYMDGKKSFRQVCSLVMLDIGRSGLDIINPQLSGDYVEFRKIELAAAINRLKNLRVEQKY